MKPSEITGTYTYRSFLNVPDIVNDFNRLRFAEAELTLVAALDGTITGQLSWPTNDDDSERAIMTITGALEEREPPLIRLHGTGAVGSQIEAFDYFYELTLAKQWAETSAPRQSLVGSVMRAKDHGTAKAGVTASVIAVQRDFLEPRDIPGVALSASATAMLAGKWHRLWHAAWHTVRGEWPNLKNPATREVIAGLGWAVVRPPRRKRSEGNNLILDNGAGEDFLFMHRWMINMVRQDYERQGLAPPASWKKVPTGDVAQIVYSPAAGPSGEVTFKRDPALSGNMVPSTGAFVNTPDYLASVMRQWEATYMSPSVLAGLSLGALGNLLEFTIHNAMHNRWMTRARDPETGELIRDPQTRELDARPSFDFSDKWDSPKYDFLGEFYSSHVNPVFWRLHGWVDDRIDDWFRAQEVSRPSAVKRRTLHGIEWFEVNAPFVLVDEPFVGISLSDHDHHHEHATTMHSGHDHSPSPIDPRQAEVETMLQVMAAIEHDDEPVSPSLATVATKRAGRKPVSMRFEMPGGF